MHIEGAQVKTGGKCPCMAPSAHGWMSPCTSQPPSLLAAVAADTTRTTPKGARPLSIIKRETLTWNFLKKIKKKRGGLNEGASHPYAVCLRGAGAYRQKEALPEGYPKGQNSLTT